MSDDSKAERFTDYMTPRWLFLLFGLFFAAANISQFAAGEWLWGIVCVAMVVMNTYMFKALHPDA